MQDQAYAPNVPFIRVTDVVDVDNINEVLLMEFSEGPEVRQVISELSEADMAEVNPDTPLSEEEMLKATKPLAQTTGLRVQRVIGTDHKTLAVYSEETQRCDLSFMRDEKYVNGFVGASTRPTEGAYGWQITLFSALSEDGNIMSILGTRPATPEETEALNVMYPGWLVACEKFDNEAKVKAAINAEKAAAFAQAQFQPPVMGEDGRISVNGKVLSEEDMKKIVEQGRVTSFEEVVAQREG